MNKARRCNDYSFNIDFISAVFDNVLQLGVQFGKIGVSGREVGNGGNFDSGSFQAAFGQRDKLGFDAYGGNITVRRESFLTKFYYVRIGVSVVELG